MDPLTFAVEVAREAGALLLERLGDAHRIEEKGGLRANLVTEADRASEALIVERIRKTFPADGVLAEEGSGFAGSSGNRWIVDPLDGTTNYAHGYPLFNVSIGYERNGTIVAGAIDAPAIGERYASERGAGVTRNGVALAVSRVAALHDALVCTGFQPARYERNIEFFGLLSRHAQAVRRDGAAALDLAFVAAGRFDGFWEFDLSPWDVAAGWLMVEEAGGRVTRIDGSAHAVDAGSILATNGRVHDEMENVLGSITAPQRQ
jgi:myo-inositol-1(or 4)-monophosphatase